MVKQTVILRKRANPKVVNLPNGRSFTSRWERRSRKQLPINIRVKRQRMIGLRRNNGVILPNQAALAFRKRKRKRKNEILNRLGPVYNRVNQSGRGLASNLAKAGIELGTKALSSEFGKKLINKGIDNIWNIFKFEVSKIKNKNVKRTMRSDIANIVVDKARSRAQNKYENLFEN